MKNQINNYFKEIEHKVDVVYKIADKARKLGFDPEDKVSIPLAKNMAERIEGLIGALIPQIIGSGLSKRIQEIEKKYGKSDLRTALTISLEVVQEKFCKFDDKIKAMEAGIRVGLAYLTMGVVSSPLEGFVELKLKKRKDGKEYFCLMYSGPIRSAGGTVGALSVVLADHIRKEMGYYVYDATEEETRRMVTELYDYHERITNLQYLPSEKEIFFLVKSLPVQISGDPSEKIEVSNYKDLERIETNRIRSGACLVLGECVAQKASKVWNQISKISEEFKLEQWSFLVNFILLQKEVKAKSKLTTKEKTLPVYTFIQDIVAGRPVLTHPLAAGGFRLRYGKSRVSGYSSTSIHPSTMHILNNYLATGTQLKMERPGKATALTVCDSIEGPIVRLKDDTVLRLNDKTKTKKLAKEIKEILFLGDILISYGDFYNRAHTLLPPGYCEEWWILEAERAVVETFGTLDMDKLEQLLEIEKPFLEKLFKDPIKTRVDSQKAFTISRGLKIPLHPKYTYHWNTLSTEDFFYLVEHLTNAKITSIDNITTKLILNYDNTSNQILNNLGIPHLVTNKEFIVIEKDDAHTISEIFNLNSFRENITEIKQEEKHINNLFLINQISDVTIKDKSGVFIGARMGRPEKAKMRKLTGSPHTLFPIGEEGGRLRSFQSAFENNKVTAEFPVYYCGKCKEKTIFSVCETCDKKTEKKYFCRTCGLIDEKKCRHGNAINYSTQTIDIKNLFDNYLKKINIKTYPDLIKGVRGTTNKDHIPEHFIKGLFRAKHDICVNKDGTTRYDMTQLPLTHFKPCEIKTSVEKLKHLGYEKDIFGNELEHNDQVLELFPQDLILPSCVESPELGADKILLKISFFIDELLEKFYKLDKFYNFQTEKDLPGILVAVIAPHTSAAVTGRVIGFSKTLGFFAHPMFHAATRRDCDGDESSVILLLDALLNFSKQYLPNTRGSTQDAPLVLTFKLVPAEVDDMIFDLDVGWKYPLEFYEACTNFKQPHEVQIDQFNKRIDSDDQYYNFGFTHNVDNINSGVRCSAYKILPSMEEKLLGQMDLAEKIRAVDEADVARLVIEKHLIRDIRGNLRKFSMQQFRCSTCNEKYRRPPLVGKCLKCNGKIIFTISEGSIVKYLEPAISLADKYNVPDYLKQNLELTKRNVESLFGRDPEKQEGLGKWFA